MNKSDYQLNIDLETGEVLYRSKGGPRKAIRISHEDLEKNPEVWNKFSGKGAYFIGTLYAAKALEKLSIRDENKKNKYFILFSILFSTSIFINNILSTKLVAFYNMTVIGAFLVYPFSYIFDYIITEVYGYQNARRVLFSIIISLIVFDISVYILVILLPYPYWHYQEHLYPIFGRMMRAFTSSAIAFSASFFISSYILQKMKIKNNTNSLFKRRFSSLLISEITDTVLFFLLSFIGIWPLEEMAKFILISYFPKVSYEIAIYNIITKPLINFIKKMEKMDIVDYDTNFTSFSWEINYSTKNNIYKD